jgi:hypothetical protein
MHDTVIKSIIITRNAARGTGAPKLTRNPIRVNTLTKATTQTSNACILKYYETHCIIKKFVFLLTKFTRCISTSTIH